jgi:site-specific recombinase XerD
MFLSNKGEGLSYGQIRKVFEECLAALDLNGTIHWLRHTFITRKIEEGASVGAVSQLVGHASPAITLRVYAHASAKMLRSITYNNLFQKE